MSTPHTRMLLVEGKEERMLIPRFMEHFFPWGDRLEDWVVRIREFDGIENMLKPGNLSSELKTPGVQCFGVIADADDKPQARWDAIRAQVEGVMPGLPTGLTSGGLIRDYPDGRRFGVWLMPDNGSQGMLETFLSLFITDPVPTLWPFVESHCANAKEHHGARYKPAHLDKSKIHSWLALEDPPGCQLHVAVMAKMLDPKSPKAEAFVTWFRKLYQL